MFLGDHSAGGKYQGDYVRDGKIILENRECGVVRRRTLLMLSASPASAQSPRLDEKRRATDPTVRSAGALCREDMRPALLRHRPVIAHFSGYGSAADGMLVVDDSGRSLRLDGDPDAGVLRLLTDSGPILPWQSGG